jgi:hypothetical protein
MTKDEQEKIDETALSVSRQKGLELLFDYTKFHIGVYLTLAASYIAATSLKDNNGLVLKIDSRFFWYAVGCFMIAGLGGGIIASSITQTTSRSSGEFLETTVGPYEVPWLKFKARYWTWIEHSFFWAGLALAAFSAQPAAVVPAAQNSAVATSIVSELIKGLPTALVALVVGLIAAYIAWRQSAIAKTKLKLDLFEKRFPIFLQTWQIFSEVGQKGTRERQYGLGNPFSNFLPQARFLFGRDVEQYLSDAVTNWTQLRGFDEQEGEGRQRNIEKAQELRMWFFNEADTGVKNMFGRYLDFESWK